MNTYLGIFGAMFARSGGPSFWMPTQSSTFARQVDFAFYFVLWICVVFFALIVGLMLLFILKYRRPKGVRAEESAHHNTSLELTWSIIPSILVLVMFYVGFKGFMDMATPPANAYEIQVTAQKWKWLFTYPNGYVDENLHMPVDVPVRLVLQSEDVIHSFYVPAFRLKDDVVPGRYGQLWFQATEPGEFDVFCAEYCGTNHSSMLATAVVHPPGEFETWLEDASNFLESMPLDQAGALLYKMRGCKQCHSTDGSSGIGPTFRGSWGKARTLKGGTTVVMDENYVRESVMNPQGQIVAGFDPVMPTFKGRLKDQEVTALIEFLKAQQ